ncbi:DNA polymerase I [Candidatus Uhrbacteria bacterium]|nr:DNA polymerase I [Candidatus Uhrbacteria bacterium]
MASPKKLFMIIDGHAVLHRAWHALPPLATKEGLVISGAYGFTTILLKAIRDLRPTHVAVTFDLKAPTFRHEEYEAYKATREKKPDELYAQVPIIEKVLAAMEIPVFTAKGFEADDVIGTISRLANKQDKDVETVIVTGDLDTLQLVDERTKVYTLRKGMTDTVIYDVKGVKERYGFAPEQLIDYKALRGDPSDNIPGVKGIGEKTGAELIIEFGTVEAIYEALEKDSAKSKNLKPSVREKLLASKKDAIQAKRLCTIVRDAPVEFDLEKCRLRPITRSMVVEVFQEFQFMKLLAQLPEDSLLGAAVSPPVAQSEESSPEAGQEMHLDDAKGVAKALAVLAKSDTVAFRSLTETDDAVTPKLLVFGLADKRMSYVLSAKAWSSSRTAIISFFGEKKRKFVCHDLKHEIRVLGALGVAIQGECFDLMIASYLLHAGERRHSLDAMLSNYRSLPADETAAEAEARIGRLAMEMPHLVGLAGELGAELAKLDLARVNKEIELPVAPVLAAMERRGVGVDVPYLTALSFEMEKKIHALTKTIYHLADGEFNINSPLQLKGVLFDKLRISTQGIKKTAKGKGLSTAASELEKLRGSHEIIDAILAYRELAKLKSTYVDALPALVHPSTGRIHANFNQTVTATGRLSSSNPNLQNIPTAESDYGKRVRGSFVADKGFAFLSADYSQIELRIAAHIANEKTMIAAFKNGEDIHWRTAVEMFGEDRAKEQRRVAKVINFGILYGMGPQRLAESANLSFEEAHDYIDRYFAIHQGIAAYMADIRDRLRIDGFVQTIFGRKRFFRNFALMNKREQAEAERQAINMPIQGSQADMLKIAMVRIEKALSEQYGDDKARMLLQVHDELVFEVKKNLVDEVAAVVTPIMEKVIELKVPILVNTSTGERWGEMNKA